jgi:conserved oligomeric Golgi complex subunit 6
MVVYDSSLLGDESEEMQKEGFQKILNAVLTPIVSMCTESASLITSKRLDGDPNIFLLNCFFYLKARTFY